MDHNVDNGRGRTGATADPTPDRDYNSQAAQAAMMDGDNMSLMAIDRKSPGVRRIEAIISVFTKIDKMWFFGALVIMTYARMLAAGLMGTYQSIALNEWGVTGQAAMVRTVRQVLTASTLPITAKMSDYIGRTFMLNTTIVFWIVGPVLVATASGLGQYLPGFLLYTLGHVAGNILNYALSIDTTTLRNRLFLQFVFIFPSVINVWASGVIAEEMVEGVGWRWGAGMWSIIAPVCGLGLVAVVYRGQFKARRQGKLDDIPSTWQIITSKEGWVHMFWVVDFVGLALLAAALALILLPLTLGGGSAAKWATANVIVPLVVGVLCLPAFAIWEWKFARHPIFPIHLMKDRHVVVILLMSFIKAIGSSTRDSYLYYTLVVSFNQSVEGATRINSLEGFASSLTVIFVAFIIRRFRLVKPLVVAGVCIMVVAQGMLIHFRGGYSRSQLAGLIAGELLDGIGTGMSSHPALVAMQAKLSHEHALLVTSCWAVGSQAGGGIAAAISGAIWTNMMPGKLFRALEAAGIPDAQKVATAVYKSPLTFVKANPPGSPAREAIVFAYRDIQKILCIIGVGIAAVLIPLALMMDNVKLEDKKNLVDESDSDSDISVPAPTYPDEKKDKDRDGRA